jgi:RNA polymerase-binding transcription factor DksA
MRTDEARSLLLTERRRLEDTLDELRVHAGPSGGSQREDTGELSGMDEHVADVASDTLEREVDLAVLHSLEAMVGAVDAALERLERGTYGRCESCGRPNDDARLRARPAATRSKDHQYVAEVADDTLRGASLHDATEMEAVAHLDLLPAEDEPSAEPAELPESAEERAIHIV